MNVMSVDARITFTEYGGLEITRPTVAVAVPNGTGVMFPPVWMVLEPALLDLEETDMFLSSLSALARYGGDAAGSRAVRWKGVVLLMWW